MSSHPPPPFHPRKSTVIPETGRRSAFTVVELIVTILVIAVLGIILFPASSLVMQKSKATGCLSNLHQISVGIFNYVAEHEGYYPHGGWPDDNHPTRTFWYEEIYPYINRNRKLFTCPAGLPLGPGNVKPWGKMPPPDEAYVFSMHYGYNGQINPQRELSPSESSTNPRKLINLSNPSRLPVVMDMVFMNNFWGSNDQFPLPANPNLGSSASNRHANHVNVIWGDGRVTSEPYEALCRLVRTVQPWNFCGGNY